MKGLIELVNNENFQCMFILLAVLVYMAVTNIFGRD